MDNLPYADILILALIAGFILLRLRSVLGQKSDQDPPQFFKRDQQPMANPQEKIVQITGKAAKAPPPDIADPYLATVDDSAVTAAVSDIKKLDSGFTLTAFLQGAKMAYEMVFDAFAKGDKKTLEMLLEKALYENFSREMDLRMQALHKTETTLVAVKPKKVMRIDVSGSRVRISVQFDSEQVSLTKDASGAIVEGNPSDVQLMDDEWVFERDVSSKNPNWKIIET